MQNFINGKQQVHQQVLHQQGPYVNKDQGQRSWWTQNWSQQRPQKYQFFHSGNNQGIRNNV